MSPGGMRIPRRRAARRLRRVGAYNVGVTAVAGAWDGTVTYYLTMLIKELHATGDNVLRTVRNLILEFGVAEAPDTSQSIRL